MMRIKKQRILKRIKEKRETAKENAAIVATMEKPERKKVVAKPLSDVPVKMPIDLIRHILKDYPIDVVQPYINRANVNWTPSGFKRKSS